MNFPTLVDNVNVFYLQSQALESILQKDFDGQEELLLGELQFCFIAFLVSFMKPSRTV